MFIISIVLSIFDKMDGYNVYKKRMAMCAQYTQFLTWKLVFCMLFKHLEHEMTIGDQMPLYNFLKELIVKMSSYNKHMMYSYGEMIVGKINDHIFKNTAAKQVTIDKEAHINAELEPAKLTPAELASAKLAHKKSIRDAINLEKKTSGQGQTPAEITKARKQRILDNTIRVIKRSPIMTEKRAVAASKAAERAAERADERANPGRAAAEHKRVVDRLAAEAAERKRVATEAAEAVERVRIHIIRGLNELAAEAAERKRETDKLDVVEHIRVAAALSELADKNSTPEAFCAAILANATHIWEGVDPAKLSGLWMHDIIPIQNF